MIVLGVVDAIMNFLNNNKDYKPFRGTVVDLWQQKLFTGGVILPIFSLVDSIAQLDGPSGNFLPSLSGRRAASYFYHTFLPISPQEHAPKRLVTLRKIYRQGCTIHRAFNVNVLGTKLAKNLSRECQKELLGKLK